MKVISIRAAIDNELKWSFGCSQETAFLVGNVETEIAAANDIPSSKEFFIHILLDLFGHLLLVWTIFECMVYDMFGLKLDFWLHFWEKDFDSPFLSSLVHRHLNKLQITIISASRNNNVEKLLKMIISRTILVRFSYIPWNVQWAHRNRRSVPSNCRLV